MVGFISQRHLARCIAFTILLHAGSASAQPLATAAPPVPPPPPASPLGGAGGAAKNEAKKEAEKTVAEVKEEAKDQVAEIRSGRLIMSGLTAGVAMSVHGRFAELNDRYISEPAVGLTPYLLIVPGYIFGQETFNAFCASNWAGGDTDVATRAATAIATKTSKRELESIVDTISVASESTKCFIPAPGSEAAALGRSVCTVYSGDGDPLVEGLDEKQVVDGCSTKVDGKCQSSRGERRVDPTVSFGAAFVPNPYLTVLAGLTYAKVNFDANTTNSTHGVWTTMVGLGGNLDLVNLLK